MKRAIAISALVALIAAALLVYLNRPEPESINEPVPATGEPPFDGDGFVERGAFRAVYDGTGSRLAVLTQQGVGIAERGRIRLLPGTEDVVELAWLQDGAHLLLADGPERVDRLRVVELTGKQIGVVPLLTAVAVAWGMAVDDDGRTAVVAVQTRTGVGAAHISLQRVDLRSGEVSGLTSADGPDEAGPFLLDDGTVAFTSTDPGGGAESVRWITAAGGDSGREPVPGRVVGVSRSSVVVASVGIDGETSVVTVGAGSSGTPAADLAAGETALAANPGAPILVVRAADGRLRRQVVTG